ncbi:ATP-dependent DNA helicase UvrD2 [Agilicoccus flavus]|uniref:ATP-dependent DNA helicase UvrD2 n=1 Tax=Agilicoccus flavus TaxID=2775968 RepID=UPI001CF6E700|nr:ATP-dependent DNA helicase UvrD2 [Agilicoccus flavus]
MSATPTSGSSADPPGAPRTPAVGAPLDPDALLAALDADQRRVAADPSGPMCVLAGAGTGKTRAITHRIAYGVHAGVYVPQRVLAVTFTARAAGEMRTRLRGLGVRGVQARTFHAAALRQLHYFWPQAVGGSAPEVLPYKAPVVAEAGHRLRLQLDRAAVRDLAAEVEWAKVNMLTHETYPAAARAARREPPGLDVTAMARVIAEYESVKTARGVIDFEDVLLLLVGIMIDREDIAGVIRSQYRHFVVDEYQDVNEVQQRLLQLWLGGRDEVCVVGDPAQTIYSFTGASPRHLLEFTTTHPGARTVRLERNYRSTPQIVEVSNAVLSGQRGAIRSPIRLRAVADTGPAPELVAYPDDDAEAAGVAQRVQRLVAGGVDPAEIAVLFRTNGQSEAIEAALADVGVPYLVRGGERFFARSEVKKGIVLLRGAARSDDGSVPLPDLVRDVLTGAGWQSTPPAGRGATRDAWESLAALAALADDLAATNGKARLRDVVADLDERMAAQHAPTVQGVTLASLHSAKGLEWDAVFLVGCSDGLMPITMAEGLEEVEEERRLLYVGLTRARRHLTLSWAASRASGGRGTRRPSRFLETARAQLGDGVTAGRDAGERSASPAGARAAAPRGRSARPAHCRGCGAELTSAAQRKTGRCDDCPPDYDEATYERLREWRAAVAKASKIPAYVVFTDATLTAVAQREPADVVSLRAVSGVGERKASRYGASALAVLRGADPRQEAARWCETAGIAAPKPQE